MKKITLSLLVLAAFCVSSSLAFAAFDGRDSIESAIHDLEDLLATGDKKSDRRIEKAIKRLEKCLKDEYWESDSTLTKKGKKVFSETKKAVHELMKMKKKKRELPDEIADAVNNLVTTAGMLGLYSVDLAKDFAGAANCVDESNEDPECKKTLKEIAKCEKEMDKAQKELDHAKKDGTPDPKYEKAIDHYKKAWEHAQKAMRKLPELEYDAAVAIGPEGGVIGDLNGAIITIPPGAIEQVSVIAFENLNENDLPIPLPLGFSFLGGIDIYPSDISFEAQVKLSIPSPAGINETNQFLVVRYHPDIDGDGSPEILLTEIAAVENDRIVTQSPPFPGIPTGGTYAFISPDITMGFLKGQIFDDVGPLSDALIKTTRSPGLSALSDTNGDFIIHAIPGNEPVYVSVFSPSTIQYAILPSAGALTIPPRGIFNIGNTNMGNDSGKKVKSDEDFCQYITEIGNSLANSLLDEAATRQKKN